MADMLESLAGNKMLMLKQEITALRERLAEVQDDEAKKAIRRELMDKETYYNILADRQRINHYAVKFAGFFFAAAIEIIVL